MKDEIDFIPFGEFRKDFRDRRHSSRVYGDCEITLWPYQVDVSPKAIEFGQVETGTVSPLRNGTLKNVGHRTLRNLTVRVLGDFTLSGVVPDELPPGESTVIKLAFAPKRSGRATGGVHVEADNVQGNHLITLVGNGDGDPVDPEPGDDWNHVADINAMLDGLWGFIQRSVGPALTGDGPAVSLPSTSVVFSTEVEVGEQSPIVQFVITNTGNETLVLNNFAVTGDFELVP